MAPTRHRPLALSLLLAASATAPLTHAAPEKAGESSLITEVKGLSFSGYENKGEGRRRWTLAAATAVPADKAGKLWTINRLTLKTFDGAGREGIAIAAPKATFNQEARTASDPGDITLTGDAIVLSGKGWTWNALENHDNRVEIRDGVRVTLAPRGAEGAKRVATHIEARTLVVQTGREGVTLTFSDSVRVRREEVEMRCDALSTLVRSGGDERAKPAAVLTDGKPAVQFITGSGHVRITRGGSVITGERATVTPANGVYAVSGDAKFTDLSDRRIMVAGDTMQYDAKAHRVVVEPGADGRVHAELPALDATRDGAPQSDEARATTSSEKLYVDIAVDRHTLVLEGEVRVDDPVNALRCGRLTVETPRTETAFASASVPGKGVSRVLAEESVEYARDGRTLRCGRAEILPKQNKALLTGAPRGEDPAHRATLEAHTMSIDTAAQSLTAESGPGRRVRVTLADRAPGAATPYAVESELLHATRHEAGAVFEFEDRVALAGPEITGGCDRLGIEVEGKSAATAGRVRRIVAAGKVTLRQAAYAAEAARAEILPGALLRELTPAEDNGLDGKSPFFVTLESDTAAGVRTRVSLPAPATPALAGAGPLVATAPVRPGESDRLTVDADFQELVAGRDRVRTFSRGSVAVASPTLNGRCATLEVRATAVPGAAKREFTPEALVARGGVTMRLGERNASADTLEVLPREQRLALIGNPAVDNWPSPPGVARKSVAWRAVTDDSGKAATRVRLADELAAGMPEQIIRPRLTLPPEMSQELGRSLRKNLDKKNP